MSCVVLLRTVTFHRFFQKKEVFLVLPSNLSSIKLKAPCRVELNTVDIDVKTVDIDVKTVDIDVKTVDIDVKTVDIDVKTGRVELKTCRKNSKPVDIDVKTVENVQQGHLFKQQRRSDRIQPKI